MKTVKFYTLGCKVNQYDTQSIREGFLDAGFNEIDNGSGADIYVINTCTVTQRADSESLSLIRKARRQNPKAKIIVTGCLAELDKDKIKEQDGVSLIVRNKDKNRIVKLLKYKNQSNEPLKLSNRGISNFSGHTRAFLKIQDGCNNFCSYCKVPFVRGPSRSKPLKAIIKEARKLAENNFKEIVLSGICLGAYGKDFPDRVNLTEVIGELENIEGLLRIRLSSIEAGDVSEELIKKMAESEKLCPHLHIPIQSGDSGILKKMNRRYTRKDYINLIGKIRKGIPGIAITTDVLVGFPGETENNFRNTLSLIKEIQPLRTHIFPYSKREGTIAADFKESINPVIIRERIDILRDAARGCALEYKRQFLNKKIQVLVEGRARESRSLWEGYADNYIKVMISSRLNLKNRLITVKFKKIVKDSALAIFVDR